MTRRPEARGSAGARERTRSPSPKLAALGIALLLAIGGPGPAAASKYFPLRPGTFWVYEVRHPEGQVELQRVLVKGTRFLRTQAEEGVIFVESGGGYAELALDVRWHPIAYYEREGFLYKFGGLHFDGLAIKEFSLGRGAERLMPIDPIAQPHWESDFDLFNAGNSGYRLRTRSDATIERKAIDVRAGHFERCLRVETVAESAPVPEGGRGQIVEFHYVDWYAPGVGLIRSEVRQPSGRLLSVSELLTFRRAPEDRALLGVED